MSVHMDRETDQESLTLIEKESKSGIRTNPLGAFLLKKALQDSQDMASKLYPKARSPHTPQYLSSLFLRLLCNNSELPKSERMSMGLYGCAIESPYPLLLESSKLKWENGVYKA